jgi:hypothetical protein
MDIESIQIHLNSKYATSYNDNTLSDCNFSLPIIEIPSQHSILLSVQHAVIPYSFYNINSKNNVLTIQEIVVDSNGNQTSTITNTLYISVGNYNAYQLASYLGGFFPSNRMSVSYDGIKNKFTFTNSTYNFKFLTAYSTCQELLGLSTNDLYNTSALKSLTSKNLINLSPTRCICLATNLQTGCINNNLQNEQNILCSIPVNTQPYSIIDYKNTNDFKVNLHNNFFNSISIKLVDDCGNLVDLNQQYFSLTLQLDIINFVE